MATVSEIGRSMLELADETDRSALSPSALLRYMQQGYREFVRRAQRADSQAFTSTAEIRFQNVSEYDFSDPANDVCLVGPVIKPLGSKPFFRIIEFALVIPGSSPVRFIHWQALQNMQQLVNLTGYPWVMLAFQPGYYLLDNYTIRTPGPVQGTFVMNYQCDMWPTGTIEKDTWLDCLGQFDDLVALLGLRFYFSRFGGEPDSLKAMRQERLLDFDTFMAQGRDVSGPDRVAILP